MKWRAITCVSTITDRGYYKVHVTTTSENSTSTLTITSCTFRMPTHDSTHSVGSVTTKVDKSWGLFLRTCIPLMVHKSALLWGLKVHSPRLPSHVQTCTSQHHFLFPSCSSVPSASSYSVFSSSSSTYVATVPLRTLQYMYLQQQLFLLQIQCWTNIPSKLLTTCLTLCPLWPANPELMRVTHTSSPLSQPSSPPPFIHWLHCLHTSLSLISVLFIFSQIGTNLAFLVWVECLKDVDKVRRNTAPPL